MSVKWTGPEVPTTAELLEVAELAGEEREDEEARETAAIREATRKDLMGRLRHRLKMALGIDIPAGDPRLGMRESREDGHVARYATFSLGTAGTVALWSGDSGGGLRLERPCHEPGCVLPEVTMFHDLGSFGMALRGSKEPTPHAHQDAEGVRWDRDEEGNVTPYNGEEHGEPSPAEALVAALDDFIAAKVGGYAEFGGL